MAGSILMLATIKRSEIRREGRRRGYHGMLLDEFVLIVSAWDDQRVSLTNAQSTAEFKAAMARNTPRRR